MKPVVALLPILLAGCAPVDSAGVSARTDARIATALSGLEPAAPQRCISRLRQYSLDIFDNRTVLFRSGRNLVYRADFPGGCGGLDASRTLAYETVVPGEICGGDTVRAVDRVTGSVVGVCAFSDFVPYVRPGSGVDPRRS